MAGIKQPSSVVKFVFALSVAFLLGADANTPTSKPTIRVDHAGLSKLTWQLAVPTNTFTDCGVFESIDALHHLTVHHLHLAPQQVLSNAPNAPKISAAMTSGDVDALLAKLKGPKMDVVSFGPVDLGTTDESARAVFEFAQRFKAKDVIASPPLDSLERLDKLASEIGVNLALVPFADSNKPTSPADLAKALDGRSKRIGVYADLAAWKQAGVDPLAAVTALKGHIVHVAVGPKDPEVNLEPIFKELKADGFKGIITVASPSGPQEQAEDGFIEAENAMSDAVTAVAGN